ncbi:HesA/MoeB/ThiF family protein [Geomonas nitrogeniifigens]|uniref:HesA/MoeB/ThiF family protein n=1 Tax=Geomonas diazotrophica TaxID=2843197 RepID=A0ABX8JCV5_9BACT|nr:HesA/MoeB/ThiF family protein [Geomonas nitrogeniifigens]QWV96215.1 HesA/MoeB/ThiF family protein [Geomonas nitrogeniifigens]QXE85282.1 HesA/MoeB/ThiF family protein [Geomonas nitrogeniifigens]
MRKVITFLKEQTNDGLLPWSAQDATAKRFSLSHAAVELLALQNGIFPARYQRNKNMIQIEEQLRLFQSRVAVIGCGGLGGYILEELARLGVGQIVAIDPDIFEEHNLNRQILSSPANLGQPKVAAAAERLAQVNPAVTVTAIQDAFCLANGFELLAGTHVAVDALDSISYRLQLAEFCNLAGIPMVHGAIGGWYGHVASQFPGETTVQQIYRHWVAGKGIEQQLGNPAFTPAVVASLEVAEVCKILLGKGEPLRNRKLSIDLLEMEMQEISYAPAPVTLVDAA